MTSMIALFSGLLCLLLMTTSYFAQGVAFVVCLAVSGFCWFAISLRSSDRWRRVARLLMLLHVAALIPAVASLRERYLREVRLNEAVRRMKLRTEAPSRRASDDILPSLKVVQL